MIAAAYSLGFVALCWVVMRALGRRGPFWGSVGVFCLCWLFFSVVFPGLRQGGVIIPGIAMVATGRTEPLPVPGFAFWSYMVLVISGIVAVVSASPRRLAETTRPIVAFFRGGGAVRGTILYVIVPVLTAWLAHGAFSTSVAPPITARQAHPSINYDQERQNTLRGDPSKQETALHRGRHLYLKNCSPCHGGKADGKGPMARALKLAPADFTDPGTIATLVEAYAFERIQSGGVGLPASGTPWDSAMPRWKGELTEEEIFMVLLAEYDIAGVSPRVPEPHK